MIKKQLILATLFFLSLSLIVFSCKDDLYKNPKENLTDPLVIEAKAWFDNQISTNSARTAGDDNKLGKKTPSWAASKTYKVNGYDVVEMPLNYEKTATHSFNGAGGDKGHKDAVLNKLLVFKDKKGVFKMQIMKLVVDLEYLKKVKYDLSKNTLLRKVNNFTGLELIYDWDEKYLFGRQFDKGFLKGFVEISDVKKKGGKIAGIACIDWYWNSYVEGVLVNSTYVFSTCGESGGGNGGDDIMINLPDLNPCEAVYITTFPLQAAGSFYNAIIAREVADAVACGGWGQADDVSINAFKHAYWNALNVRTIGNAHATAAGHAHECIGNSVSNRMDRFNNALGRSIALNNPDADESELRQIIANSICNGEGRIVNSAGLLATSNCFNICP
jgi:hypothetical protein